VNLNITTTIIVLLLQLHYVSLVVVVDVIKTLVFAVIYIGFLSYRD